MRRMLKPSVATALITLIAVATPACASVRPTILGEMHHEAEMHHASMEQHHAQD